MKIYHLEFAKTGTGISGGETSMVEIINCLAKMGYSNVLLTTDNGKKVYDSIFPDLSRPEFITIKSFWSEEKYGPFVSYIIRLKMINKVIKNLEINSNDAVFCHSEFLPNSYALYKINKVFTPKYIAAMFHMKAPGIFRGYEGEFTGRYQFPRATIIHYKLTQFLYRIMTPKKAIVFTVNDFYRKFLEKKYKHNKVVVLEHYGGRVEATAKNKKNRSYDLIWVGRFHAQKGLSEFVKIVALIKEKKPNIKAVVLGGGNDDYESKARHLAEDLGVDSSIEFAGFITGKEKEQYYSNSKIFVMTSYYESFGQVILEAMSHGLPVTGYRLPVYSVFGDSLYCSDLLDNVRVSNRTVELLANESLYKRLSRKSFLESKSHSWDWTARQILSEMGVVNERE